MEQGRTENIDTVAQNDKLKMKQKKSEKILRCSSEKANEDLKPQLHNEFLKCSLVKQTGYILKVNAFPRFGGERGKDLKESHRLIESATYFQNIFGLLALFKFNLSH